MPSTQKVRDRIDGVLKELQDLSSALDARDPTDPHGLLRAITTENSGRLLFIHMELQQLVTFLVTRWWPDWEPPCTNAVIALIDMRADSVDPRRFPPRAFGLLFADIRSTWAAIFDQRAASRRNGQVLEHLLFALQAQLTRHSAYCMHMRLHVLRDRAAAQILERATTTA